ncbi:peptide MFS transporter [Clostridium sp.]|uniref:peptide MFS transporter n=1 Tax=Clostridium sp. TaxID=1506 RepID=UPI0026291AC0|nr:peptide MFS transporter [Clostridium sp.]
MTQVSVVSGRESSKKRLKHPAGLYLLFFTEMWERFSYYGMRALLMLYLTASFVTGGLGYDVSHAASIYGTYTGLVYFTPIIGGELADKYLGQKKSIIIGAILMIFGNLSLFAWQTRWALYLGLGLIIIGNAFFKPNISTLVGQLYEDGDKRKDSAFTIFYMGINLGSLIAPIICGLLAENFFATKSGEVILHYGFKYGFLAAAIGIILGEIIFITLSPKYLAHVGKNKKEEVKKEVKEENKPLTKQEKKRIAVILILASFVVFFWAGFEQAGTSLTLFAEKATNRSLFGWTVPISFFQSINPLFILILAPLFSKLWFKLANSKRGDLSVPTKMAMGMIVLGCGFLLMVIATMSLGGNVENPAVKVSMFWLIGTYFFNTVGELCLSPIGLSMVSSLAPAKYASLLMGVWLASNGVANKLSGFIASFIGEFGALELFAMISGVSIGLGLILLLLSKKISKMME